MKAGKSEVRAERRVGDGAIAEHAATQVGRAHVRSRAPNAAGKSAAVEARCRDASALARERAPGGTAGPERTCARSRGAQRAHAADRADPRAAERASSETHPAPAPDTCSTDVATKAANVRASDATTAEATDMTAAEATDMTAAEAADVTPAEAADVTAAEATGVTAAEATGVTAAETPAVTTTAAAPAGIRPAGHERKRHQQHRSNADAGLPQGARLAEPRRPQRHGERRCVSVRTKIF